MLPVLPMRHLAMTLLLFTIGVFIRPALAAIGEPPPPVSDGLLDCSLYRYGDRFDAALSATLKRMADATFSDDKLQTAFNGPQRLEVTQRLYQLHILQRVPDCSQPVVKGFAGAGRLELQIAALQKPVCQRLVASETLRLAGLLVEPLHVPSGELSCGMARNPIPGFLTLGRLTQAGRSLPGNNTVTLINRGPFPAPAPVVSRPNTPPTCPGINGRVDPLIENMIANHQYVSYDYPRRWQGEPCFDIIGGPSSVGMTCNVANWNNHQQYLYREFEDILSRAESSGDRERIMSAAYWLIERNDPSKLTILSFDYEGQDCDAIRNRIVTAWGLCMWDPVKQVLKEFVRNGTTDLRKIDPSKRDKMLESVFPCFMEVPDRYKDADKFLNDWLRPMPAPEKRRQILAKVQQRVRSAMAHAGYGDCKYYSDAVMRLDQSIWQDEYALTVDQLPVDWEHDFWKSAQRCAAQPW